jgi:hypothetical protein
VHSRITRITLDDARLWAATQTQKTKRDLQRFMFSPKKISLLRKKPWKTTLFYTLEKQFSYFYSE